MQQPLSVCRSSRSEDQHSPPELAGMRILMSATVAMIVRGIDFASGFPISSLLHDSRIASALATAPPQALEASSRMGRSAENENLVETAKHGQSPRSL